MTATFAQVPPFVLPRITDAERADLALREVEEACSQFPELAEWWRLELSDGPAHFLARTVFSHSPFLTRCATAEPAFLREVFRRGPDNALRQVIDHLKDAIAGQVDKDDVQRELREARRRVALVVALADITQYWTLDQVTQALSDFSDAALSTCVSHLLRQESDKGEIVLADENFPERECGYAILAMGKHGARELNYSSDIDLIVLYEPAKVEYLGGRSVQQTFVRMTKTLVGMMQDRTQDGYVCRVDLRLRPDPGSTPVAISYAAAQTYYEKRGENWERAAMIKARAAAGDLTLGRKFLEELSGFIWRDHLDFWTLREIEAIKKRINTERGSEAIGFHGHNIKLGRGGIREIEFYAQTQQLIFGGRDPYLRCQRTVEALSTLAEAGRIEQDVAEELIEAYEFLRRLEHRLQMVDDQQTQTLPTEGAGMAELAAFMAFDGVDSFRGALMLHLRRVEVHYVELFESIPDLSAIHSLSFVSDISRPEDVAHLSQLGFPDPSATYDRVRAWLSDHSPATRGERSADILEKLLPSFVEAASRTSAPDDTLESLQGFLSSSRVGQRTLSLLYSNPALRNLMVEVLCGAPALSQTIAAHPDTLESALGRGFFEVLPEGRLLAAECAELGKTSADTGLLLGRLSKFVSDHKFQVAVNSLRHSVDALGAGHTLADITSAAVRTLFERIRADLDRDLGAPRGRMVVLALGAFGSRDQTHATPLDLLFLYECDEGEERFFIKLARGLATALSANQPGGPLYRINMSIEPWGAPGPIVSRTAPFFQFITETNDLRPWRVLLPSRVVAGSSEFGDNVQRKLSNIFQRRYDESALEALARDVLKQPATRPSMWRPKGLQELDGLVALLQLRHVKDDPSLLASTDEALRRLGERSVLRPDMVKHLQAARHLLRQVENISAIIGADATEIETNTPAMIDVILRATQSSDSEDLNARLAAAREHIGEAVLELPETADALIRPGIRMEPEHAPPR